MSVHQINVNKTHLKGEISHPPIYHGSTLLNHVFCSKVACSLYKEEEYKKLCFDFHL